MFHAFTVLYKKNMSLIHLILDPFSLSRRPRHGARLYTVIYKVHLLTRFLVYYVYTVLYRFANLGIYNLVITDSTLAYSIEMFWYLSTVIYVKYIYKVSMFRWLVTVYTVLFGFFGDISRHFLVPFLYPGTGTSRPFEFSMGK